MTITSTPVTLGKSCLQCPSYRSADQMMNEYSSSIGCAFCPTTGRVLTTPPNTTDHEDHQRLLENVAEACASFGSPAAPADNWDGTAAIGYGNPQVSVVMSQKAPVPSIDKPFSCTSCQWFVPGPIVNDELGYDAPLCAAKGRLLFPRNYLREAANCGTGLNGPNLKTTNGVILSADYTHLAPIPVPPPVLPDLVVEASRHAVDPRTYFSDKPISPEDEAKCVRAWRQIEDPEGLHESKWLPIYNGEKLGGFDPRETYGNMRPDLYVDHAGLLYDLACELLDGEAPLFIGGAGTGKSEAGCYLAYLMDLPFIRIVVEKRSESDDFIGTKELETDAMSGTPITQFYRGRFAEWFDKPCVMLVDEPNLKQDIYEFLRPAIDGTKEVSLDKAGRGGVKVQKHEANYLLLAQNPGWDPLYVGAEPMSAAEIDRVSPIWFDLPSEPVERQIIKAHCNDIGYDIPDKMVDKIMKVAHDLRGMITDGTLPIAWGLRAQIKVAKKTRHYSFEKAYRRAVIDGMEPSVMENIMRSVKSHAGSIPGQGVI